MKFSKCLQYTACATLGISFSVTALAQAPAHYDATIQSLDQHPLPQWFDDAKLGIFIHWGLYSVPGWAPLTKADLTNPDLFKAMPYAEWYLNSARIDGSPTQAYDREHYGAHHDYYDFAETFDSESKKWNPDVWAKVFKDAGAKYVVLTTKHHEGYTLWPSVTPNPVLPPARQHASRDVVSELTASVRKEGLKMGLYYSGGLDWTFVPGPITSMKTFPAAMPQSEAYGKYVDAQYRELIDRYHPAVLWNDIGYPKSGNPMAIEADYYNAVPDGVVDDRFDIKHHDYTTPEYTTLKDINPKKWEECRGLGQSFGYNRAEGEAQTIAPDKLIYLLVDIVSKNGNLLLDVGPEADGTIPALQLDRLRALGAWLDQNGEAIYGTHPWTRAEGKTSDGIDVRFTQKNSNLYVTLMGEVKGSSVTVTSLKPKPGTNIQLLGYKQPLKWSQAGDDVKVSLPPSLPGKYAYVLRVEPAGAL
jgi:alpha-L-fucosidase